MSGSAVWAQSLPAGTIAGTVTGNPDSLQTAAVLTLPSFLNWVTAQHPVVRQAALIAEKAKADLLYSRQAFDPLLTAGSEQKTLDGHQYYTYSNTELKLPAWYGFDVKAGIEHASGEYISPENTPGPVHYAGISVPLAKGLLMDKRRAQLLQARVFVSQSEADRKALINDLMYEAASTYWEWSIGWQLYLNAGLNLEINTRRLAQTKTSYLQGAGAAIDTLEALAQVQAFRYLQQEALLKFRLSGTDLSNFLWAENGNPVTLPYNVLPDTAATAQALTDVLQQVHTDTLTAYALQNNPALQSSRYKLRASEIDKKLKFQGLLPYINLKANVLSGSGYGIQPFQNGYLLNNNKYGIEVAVPLRFSEGRADYRKAKLKISELNNEISLKSRSLGTKITKLTAEIAGLGGQLAVQEQAYRSYGKLYQAEEQKYRAGESSLFVLNTRENKMAEQYRKLLELRYKLLKAGLTLKWSLGRGY